jgi:hypothetical protein
VQIDIEMSASIRENAQVSDGINPSSPFNKIINQDLEVVIMKEYTPFIARNLNRSSRKYWQMLRFSTRSAVCM